MINSKNAAVIKIILVSTFLLSAGCNNQRNNRLSASNACDTSVRFGKKVPDPTAYDLTEDQQQVFTEVNTSEFPDDEALAVTSIVSTFEIPLNNEERAIIRLSNQSVQINPNTPSVACALNIPEDASGERTVEMPTSNQNGEIQLKRFKIEIGNPTKEDQSDYIRVTLVKDETPEENTENEETEPAPPVPFSNFFSSAQDQVTYYKLIDNNEKDKSAEELQKISYFIHYKNDVDRVRSRITVTRVIKTDK